MARFCSGNWRRFRPDFFGPFLRVQAEPTPPQIPKSTPIYNIFSQWFLWGLDPGTRRCLMPISQICKLTNSVLGTSSDTTERAPIQWLRFSARERSQRFKVMKILKFWKCKLWRIFGGKCSVNFLQENRLNNCHRKLHHILHCKRRNLSSGTHLSGTDDSQHDSRESIRAKHSQLKPLFL